MPPRSAPSQGGWQRQPVTVAGPTRACALQSMHMRWLSTHMHQNRSCWCGMQICWAGPSRLRGSPCRGAAAGRTTMQQAGQAGAHWPQGSEPRPVPAPLPAASPAHAPTGRRTPPGSRAQGAARQVARCACRWWSCAVRHATRDVACAGGGGCAPGNSPRGTPRAWGEAALRRTLPCSIAQAGGRAALRRTPPRGGVRARGCASMVHIGGPGRRGHCKRVINGGPACLLSGLKGRTGRAEDCRLRDDGATLSMAMQVATASKPA